MYTKDDISLSHLSDELLGFLDQTFPDTLPKNEQMSEKEIWIRYGQVSVVRKLKALRHNLEKN